MKPNVPPIKSADETRGDREPESAGITIVGSLEPLLVVAEQAAAVCGVSRDSWDRYTAAGKTPAPRRLGGRPLWSTEELRAWVRHGCLPRPEWETLWQSLQSQAGGRGRQR